MAEGLITHSKVLMTNCPICQGTELAEVEGLHLMAENNGLYYDVLEQCQNENCRALFQHVHSKYTYKPVGPSCYVSAISFVFKRNGKWIR